MFSKLIIFLEELWKDLRLFVLYWHYFLQISSVESKDSVIEGLVFLLEFRFDKSSLPLQQCVFIHFHHLVCGLLIMLLCNFRHQPTLMLCYLQHLQCNKHHLWKLNKIWLWIYLPTNKLVIAQEPLLSSIFKLPPENFSTASIKYYSAFLKPLIIACLGFSGNSGSRMIN